MFYESATGLPAYAERGLENKLCGMERRRVVQYAKNKENNKEEKIQRGLKRAVGDMMEQLPAEIEEEGLKGSKGLQRLKEAVEAEEQIMKRLRKQE